LIIIYYIKLHENIENVENLFFFKFVWPAIFYSFLLNFFFKFILIFRLKKTQHILFLLVSIFKNILLFFYYVFWIFDELNLQEEKIFFNLCFSFYQLGLVLILANYEFKNQNNFFVKLFYFFSFLISNLVVCFSVFVFF
jgi:hypothetical protein